MSQDLEELPLFPLNTVLFPYATLRLHIFEDRYREMVRACLADDRPFGIVLIRSGSEIGGRQVDPYLVGTAVRVVQVETYDDGRMDIQVIGERRFRIRHIDEESHPFLIGHVEPVVEHPIEDTPANSEFISQTREEFEILIQRLFQRQEFSVQVVFPSDPTALSFTMANLLPMENIEKQRMLEQTDTMERFDDLRPILEGQMLEAKPPAYYRIGVDDLRDWTNPN